MSLDQRGIFAYASSGTPLKVYTERILSGICFYTKVNSKSQPKTDNMPISEKSAHTDGGESNFFFSVLNIAQEASTIMIAIWRNECFGGFRLKVNIGRTSHKKSLCQHYFQFWTIWTLLINVMATQHSVYPEPQCLIPCRQQRQAICELKAYWMLQKKQTRITMIKYWNNEASWWQFMFELFWRLRVWWPLFSVFLSLEVFQRRITNFSHHIVVHFTPGIQVKIETRHCKFHGWLI